MRYNEDMDKIAIIGLGLTGNSIGMALAWLGVVQAGLVAVATMPLLRAKELGEIIEKAQPKLA